ncbi:MAG: hypothetical protein KTR28_07930 [Micavibrio sp.]|nr:hypothetical protein [Micavibrio sp.]
MINLKDVFLKYGSRDRERCIKAMGIPPPNRAPLRRRKNPTLNTLLKQDADFMRQANIS